MTKKTEMVGKQPVPKRRALWIGSLAVFLPLLILLALQYWWLGNLKRTSTIAHKATMQHYVSLLQKEVEFFYRSNAERALDIPSYLMSEGKWALYKTMLKRTPGSKGSNFELGTKSFYGARYIFFMSFVGNDADEMHVYDPQTRKLLEEIPEHVDRAISWGSIYWVILGQKHAVGDYSEMRVEESYPELPLIIYPITNDESQLVGVTGYVVDVDFFREIIIPKLVNKFLPKKSGRADLQVRIFDNQSKSVMNQAVAERRIWGDDPHEVSDHFNFVFTDWWVGVRGNATLLEQWAGTNFIFNMTLSLVLALVLTTGIVLALRTASHELQVSEMKNDFVSNVSHELRTPLASIRVFGEMLRLGRVDTREKVREYGEYIETEGRRLSALIENILDFSKIESGQKLYRFEPVYLEDVLRRVLKTFEVRLMHGGIEIDYQPPQMPIPVMTVDPDAIGQAFFNLLDNAVKYGGDQAITVNLRMREADLEIAVRDRGIGIAAEDQEKIFDRFHRVSTGLVHDVKGSGLGLALVKHIVNAHGGSLAVKSELGEGSTFTMRLPI